MINSCLPNLFSPIVHSVSWLSSQVRSGFEKFVGLFQGAKNVSQQFDAENGTPINLDRLNSLSTSWEFKSAQGINTVKTFCDAQTQTEHLNADHHPSSASSPISTDSPANSPANSPVTSPATKLTSLQWLRRLVGSVPSFTHAESTDNKLAVQRQSQSDSKLNTMDSARESQSSDSIKRQLEMMAIDAMRQFKGEQTAGKNLIHCRIEALQEHCRDTDSTKPLSKLDDAFRGLHVNLKGIVEDHPEGADKELAKEMANYFSQFRKGGEFISMDQARELLTKVLAFRSALQSIPEAAA